MPRPLSVTVVALFLIVTSLLPLSQWLRGMVGSDQSFLLAGVAANLLAGVGILARQSWGRWLFVAWIVAFLGYEVMTLPGPAKIGAIPHGIVFLVIASFLFRPAANDYFAGVAYSEEKDESPSNS